MPCVFSRLKKIQEKKKKIKEKAEIERKLREAHLEDEERVGGGMYTVIVV